MENEWAKKNTIQCEVKKISMVQDKNGHVLKLAIHPHELPSDLVLDPLGSRYVMVLAKLNDQDEIEVPKEKTEGERAVDSAGLLCRNPRFQKWFLESVPDVVDPEQSCVSGICFRCNIVSRSELRTNKAAREEFYRIRESFNQALKKGEVEK